MELTDELLMQIIGADRLRFGDRSTEKRHLPRIPFSLPAVLQPMDRSALPLPVRVRDISKSGIGLLCLKEILPKTPFWIRLPQQQGHPLWISCTAARCQSMGDDLFIIGATFDKVVDPHPATASPALPSATPLQQGQSPATGQATDSPKGPAPTRSIRGTEESQADYLRRRRAQRNGTTLSGTE